MLPPPAVAASEHTPLVTEARTDKDGRRRREDDDESAARAATSRTIAVARQHPPSAADVGCAEAHGGRWRHHRPHLQPDDLRASDRRRTRLRRAAAEPGA